MLSLLASAAAAASSIPAIDLTSCYVLQLTQKKTALQFKALDQTLQTHDKDGVKQALSYRCADIDRIVPGLMGVSKVGRSGGFACIWYG